MQRRRIPAARKTDARRTFGGLGAGDGHRWHLSSDLGARGNPQRSIHAVTFVINRASERYVGRLPEDELVERLTKASGYLGSCAEYLHNIVTHMRESGIHDAHMFHLDRLVAGKASK